MPNSMFVAALIASASILVACAQAPVAAPPQSKDALSNVPQEHGVSSTPGSREAAAGMTSQEFVTKATEESLAEIRIAHLALARSRNANVRQFAQKTIDAYMNTDVRLGSLAEAANLKVPDDTDLAQKGEITQLQAKAGLSFDASYLEQMHRDHQKTIALFEAAAKSDRVDKPFREFASRTLPTFEQHDEFVKRLAVNESQEANR